jgi:hypothetical protein
MVVFMRVAQKRKVYIKNRLLPFESRQARHDALKLIHQRQLAVRDYTYTVLPFCYGH